MKKIDLHTHTVPTISDSDFKFSLEKLCDYVASAKIDAIAITNHDIFDLKQFTEISAALDINVFPGIEVNLENGHVLIISDVTNLDDFCSKCKLVSQKIINIGDTLTVEELETIFGNLHNYLVIPHYENRPAVKGEALEKIKKYITSGEVDSPKKFVRAIKDSSKLTPVLFSDARFRDEMSRYPTRQTYVDCGDLTLNSLKACFSDKRKIALSENDGNDLFQIFDNGQKLSTGLNILLGERSTGKTHTLDRINITNKNTKYIEQFSLVQQDEETYAKRFNDDVAKKESIFIEDYLAPYKTVLHEALNIDLHHNEKLIENYIETLLQSADEAEKKDVFSKTALFNETAFKISDDKVLVDLINSVRQVIENIEYRSIVEKHLDMDSLKTLALELIEMLWDKVNEKKKKRLTNSIVRDVQDRLRRRTSATHVEDLDLYQHALESKTIERFEEITKYLQKECVISEESVQGFRVIAKKRPFKGSGEIKKVSKSQLAFSEVFKKYNNPYNYLMALKENETLTPSEFYKYFVKIDYEILNKDGYKVSGGERSEFRLLQEIKDAQNYDILLIDEPESSFDNIFLNSEVNQIIKEISETMPVVVVTHNSTVGASIKADYVIYASKETEDGKPKYRLYSGHPADIELISVDGKKKKNFDVTINSLEAGSAAYNERRQGYENIKN